MFRNYSKYEVYPDGKIWSYSRNKWLKPITKKNGYQQVHLSDNEGKRKLYYLHRVVWESVTGSPIPEGYEINHRSEAKDENMISNLELLTHKENMNFGSRNSRAGKSISKANTNNPNRSKSVGAFDKNGELVMAFPSIAECGRQGFSQANVCNCCRGVKNYKTHKGYIWRYI